MTRTDILKATGLGCDNGVVDALEDHESVCMNVGVHVGSGAWEHESVGGYSFEWVGE